jgi:hypothetical protein
MVDRDDQYPNGVVDPKIRAQIQKLESQQNLIGVARRQMQAQYPALAVIDSATVANSTNAQLLGQIGDGFGKIQSNIQDLSQQIQKDPSKALFLDDVVKGTLDGLKIDPNNPNQSDTNKAIVDYLKGEQTKDNLIKWGGTILTGGLTIGTILATMGTGGAALPFALGLGGALTGLGTAAYEYRELAAIDLAANAQQGGTKLTSQDKETAQFNLMMGRVNLVMAGLDVGLSVKAATGLLKGAKSVEQMSTFTKAMKAQKAGELGDALDALQPLRKELGEDAYKEIEKAWVQATGSRYVGIDADVTPKLVRQYENLARLSEKEIGEIVKNTGIPRKFINRVQEHLFVDQHEVWMGSYKTGVLDSKPKFGNFTPDQDVANLWLAAKNGKLEGEELKQFQRLISHEYIEQGLMKAGLPYRSRYSWSKDKDRGWGFWAQPGRYGAHDLAPNQNLKNPAFSHWNTEMGKSPEGLTIQDDMMNIDQVLQEIKRREKLQK